MEHNCPVCEGLLVLNRDTGNYDCDLCFKEFSEKELQECENAFTLREGAWNLPL